MTTKTTYSAEAMAEYETRIARLRERAARMLATKTATVKAHRLTIGKTYAANGRNVTVLETGAGKIAVRVTYRLTTGAVKEVTIGKREIIEVALEAERAMLAEGEK